METLTGLLKQTAVKFPDRRAISVSDKFDITYSHLDQLIDQAAGSLVAAGVSPGDVVALTFPNTVEFVIMFLAVIRVRATAAPLNPAYTAEEFEFYLLDSESKILLTAKEGIAAAVSAAAKIGIRHVTTSLHDVGSGIHLSSVTESESDSLTKIVNEPSDVALFLHTSGTTSRPKGVPLTQLNLASSVNNIKSVYKLTEFDSTVIVLPLFHVHGLLVGLLSSLGAGGAVTLPSAGRFSASTFWLDMVKCNATWYTGVPTIHQIILDRHLSKPEPSYPKLRFIRSCSASLAPSILARLEEAFGAPVLEAYAMTEATHLMSSNPLPENGPHVPGSVGKPVGQEMAILDENGVEQKAGVNGEVCIRGLNVTSGYKNNPEANKSAFSFGWFHTGDFGYFDSDGYLRLVDRIREAFCSSSDDIDDVFSLDDQTFPGIDDDFPPTYEQELKFFLKGIAPASAPPQSHRRDSVKPPYKVSKHFDKQTQQRVLLFQVEFPEISDLIEPSFRIMPACEQNVEQRVQSVLFSAEQYQTICFEVPNDEIDELNPKNFSYWDSDHKLYTVQLYCKRKLPEARSAGC